MNVSFTLTLKEYRKYQRYSLWRNRQLKNNFISKLILHLIVSIALGYLIGVFTLLFWLVNHQVSGTHVNHQMTTTNWIFVYSVCALIFGVIRCGSFFLRRLKVDRLYKQSVLTDGQIVSIFPECTESETPSSKLQVKWSAVYRVSVTPDLILVYVRKRGAMIIPKRAFGSQQEISDFVDLIAKYREVN